MAAIDIQIATSDALIPKQDQFLLWATAALESRKPNAQLSIRIVDKAESQNLNRDYRGKDKPTNVLSFPCELPADIDIPLIGDIAICAEIVEEEASSQGKLLEAHWAHMLVHGVLHLLGYDHIDDDEALEMERLETEIIKGFGYDAPYESTEENLSVTIGT